MNLKLFVSTVSTSSWEMSFVEIGVPKLYAEKEYRD